MPRVVTLTTDFGTGSDYVAQLKGRLLHARAPVTLVDLAHDLPPHDVRAAAWLVGQACPTFPADTLHVVVVVVVDPGMGTARRLAWARIGGQEFLAPDNGVLSWTLHRAPLEAAHALAVPAEAAVMNGSRRPWARPSRSGGESRARVRGTIRSCSAARPSSRTAA
jgi:S-adenosylmethionine hydrolase